MQDSGLTPQQRDKHNRFLRQLPSGDAFYDWVAREVGERIGEPVGWEFTDQGQAAQDRSGRINLLNSNGEVLCTIEPSRDEVARSQAVGEDWIDHIVAMIGDEEQQRSGMHQKFEQDMMSQYEDMMNKLTGENDD